MKTCVCGSSVANLDDYPVHFDLVGLRVVLVEECHDEWRRESEATGV